MQDDAFDPPRLISHLASAMHRQSGLESRATPILHLLHAARDALSETPRLFYLPH